MRYLFTITFIACGAHAIEMHDTSDNSVVVDQDSVGEKEKFTDEIEQNLAKNSKKENAPRYSQQSIPMVKDKPIPALILLAVGLIPVLLLTRGQSGTRNR